LQEKREPKNGHKSMDCHINKNGTIGQWVRADPELTGIWKILDDAIENHFLFVCIVILFIYASILALVAGVVSLFYPSLVPFVLSDQ